MGTREDDTPEKQSPWDILQIDETGPDKKASHLTEDLFFKRSHNVKKEEPKQTKTSRPPKDNNQITTASESSEQPDFLFTKPKSKKGVKSTSGENNKVKIDFTLKTKNLIGGIKAKVDISQMQLQTKKTWLTIFTILPLIAFFYWVISPAGAVQKIEVTGNTQLSAKDVIQATGIRKNRSIFGVFLHEAQIGQQAVATNPELKNVEVTIISPTQVKVDVEEATRVGYILHDKKYYLILEGGEVLEQPLNANELGLPIYEGFNNKKLFRQVITNFASLDAPIRSAVSEIQFAPDKDDPSRIKLYMNDGNQVNAKISTFADKMAYYPSIAAQMDQPGVVNLEVGAFSYSYEQIKLNEQMAAQKKAEAEAKKAAEKDQKDNSKDNPQDGATSSSAVNSDQKNQSAH